MKALFRLMVAFLLIASKLVAQKETRTGQNDLRLYLEQFKNHSDFDNDTIFVKKIPGWQAAADLRILMQAMQEAQPGLYRYATPRQVNEKFKNSLEECKDSVAYLSLARNISEIISITGCAHSGWRHSDAYFTNSQNLAMFFPFDIAITGNSYYIRRNNCENTEVKDGSKILSINQVPMKVITAKLEGMLEHEGNNRTHIQRVTEENFPYIYSTFIENPVEFTLRLLPPGTNKIIKVTVPAQTMDAILAVKEQRYPTVKKENLPLQFTYDEGLATGTYTIEWFNENYIKKKGQDFLAFTDSVFSTLQKKNAENIIIDIRNNGGGLTAYGKYLFSYFIDKPYPFIESVTVGKTDGYFFEPLITAAPPYNDTMTFQKTSNELRIWTNNPNLHVYPAPGSRFTRNIYILINGNSMSCSGIFASAMRMRTKAVFLGEESGGVMGGLNGMSVSLRLPYSKINIYLSTAMYMNAGNPQNKKRGVIPDYPVEPPITDTLKGKDTVIAFTLAQIKAHRNKNRY